MKKKHSILVVDDERENLNLLANVLGEEYFVHKTRDPEAAVGLLKDHDIRLVLTDQRMPRMTGVALLEKLQQEGAIEGTDVTSLENGRRELDRIRRLLEP